MSSEKKLKKIVGTACKIELILSFKKSEYEVALKKTKRRENVLFEC